jgi:dipeptidase E
MRLFLSSYRAGKHDDKLRELIGKIDKIAVITNAKDYKTPQDRKIKLEDNFEYYRSIGLEPTEIDLRPYFQQGSADNLLDGFKFIWLAGGNAFLLRRALRYTELDKWLIGRAKRNEIILGGESAGAIIMGPTLMYSEVENEKEDSQYFAPKPYKKEIIWEGLNLVNFVPVPHFNSPGYIGIDEYIENLKKDKIDYKKMTDDQAIIINDDKEEFLS